jgi:hypothetical protein
MTLHVSLDGFFEGAAGKILTAVEANPVTSNQHEFNGVTRLKDLLGEPPVDGLNLRTRFLFLDDDADAEVVLSRLTWYDARANHPTRSECRLYYPPNYVMDGAGEGDYMVLARLREGVDPDAEMVVIISAAASSTAAQLQHLFGLEPSQRLDVEPLSDDRDLSFTSRQLIESLGYEITAPEDDGLEEMLEVFGGAFPNSVTFSRWARHRTRGVEPWEDPDGALLAWMDKEESLYRTLERHLLSDRLKEAAGDVDRTLEIAMQTFQRRRARAGRALENHVSYVLDQHGIPFDSQARTEGRKQPDFLFPGSLEYQDENSSADDLRMLAVKTTCKDRWRQVLTEADRIPRKHLLTLEAPISLAQTSEMRGAGVQLVVPVQLHPMFEPEQQLVLMSVRTLLEELRRRYVR